MDKDQKLDNLQEAVTLSVLSSIEGLPDGIEFELEYIDYDKFNVRIKYDNFCFDEMSVPFDEVINKRDAVLAEANEFATFYSQLKAYDCNLDNHDDDEKTWVTFNGIGFFYVPIYSILKNKDETLSNAKEFKEFYPQLKNLGFDLENDVEKFFWYNCTWLTYNGFRICYVFLERTVPEKDKLMTKAKEFIELYRRIKLYGCDIERISFDGYEEEIWLTYNYNEIYKITEPICYERDFIMEKVEECVLGER